MNTQRNTECGMYCDLIGCNIDDHQLRDKDDPLNRAINSASLHHDQTEAARVGIISEWVYIEAI